MKDYSVNIIDYRGGKALLLDSLDIMHLTSTNDIQEAMELIEKNYEEVDYVLLITSMPFNTLRPKIRAFFTQPYRSQVNCYRHITEKGKQTWNNYLKEQTKSLTDNLKLNRRTEK